MYSTIVVPIDPENYATAEFEPARSMSELFGAEIVLVGLPGVIARHKSAFETGSSTVSHRSLAPNEKPAAGVADVVGCHGHERTLIVAATHARGRLGYAMSGSTAEDILRASQAHVLLIGPRCDAKWIPAAGPALVCLDGSALAERALPAARGWAQETATGLHVLRVIESVPMPPPIDPRTGTFAVDVMGDGLGDGATMLAMPDPLSEDVVLEAAETYIDVHADLLANRGIDATGAVRSGHRPAQIIADYITDVGVNLAVLTTHGRSGIGRVVLGSTTMDLARRATCPILTMTPT